MDSFAPVVIPCYIIFYVIFALCYFKYAFTYSTHHVRKVKNIVFDSVIFCLVIAIAYIIGSRDYNVGTDTMHYLRSFLVYKKIVNYLPNKDILFGYLMKFMARVSDYSSFLKVCALLYVMLPLFTFKKMFKYYYCFPLLLFFISPLFNNAGSNIMRNGVAASIFLFAFFFSLKKLRYVVMAISVGVHAAMILPFCAYLFTEKYKNTKILMRIFFLLLAVYFLGLRIYNYIDLSVLFPTREMSVYFEDTSGTNWSFFFYGLLPVLIGYYFIKVEKIADDFYIHLFNTYVICTYVGILFLDASMSIRFTYLSSFLTPVVVSYPLLSSRKISKVALLTGFLVLFFLKSYSVFF